MDVCGHNESDVELNLRTLREKPKNRKKYFFSLVPYSQKICMKKSQRENLKNPFYQGITVHIINYIYYK